jgi:hypothetical protein
MAGTGPLRMFCTYRVKDGKEADFLKLLEKHWPTLHNQGLATGDPAQVFRTQDRAGRTIFVEMFSWKDEAAPDVAHQTPEVMSVWEPMGALTDEMNFWTIDSVAMPFAKA